MGHEWRDFNPTDEELAFQKGRESLRSKLLKVIFENEKLKKQIAKLKKIRPKTVEIKLKKKRKAS